jgi:hypothetical protein
MKAPQKRLIFGIIVAAVLSQIIAHYDQLLPYRWETFNSPDGTFSVSLPGKPVADNGQEISVADGGTTLIHGVKVSPYANSIYECTYFEDPSLGTQPPDELLDHARDGGLKNVQGTLIAEKHITVDGYPARDIQAHARGNSSYNSRLIIAGNRLYMLMVIDTSGPNRDAKNVQKFFDSFKINAK